MITTQNKFEVKPYHIGEAEKMQYDTEGYVLLKNVLSKEQTAELHEEVMAIMKIIGLEIVKLKQTHQYLFGSALDHFVHSIVMREIASALTGGPSTLYLPFTAVKSGGGGGCFHFHQDNQYTRHDGPSINLWTALSPMTAATGCLQIIPRSRGYAPQDQVGTEGFCKYSHGARRLCGIYALDRSRIRPQFLAGASRGLCYAISPGRR